VPASEPDVAWFADVLAGAPPPAGVRADTTDVGRTLTLCTFVVDLTAGEAVILPSGTDSVTIPLGDLACGNANAQRAIPIRVLPGNKSTAHFGDAGRLPGPGKRLNGRSYRFSKGLTADAPMILLGRKRT
jgi:hypothetical protein